MNKRNIIEFVTKLFFPVYTIITQYFVLRCDIMFHAGRRICINIIIIIIQRVPQ